MSESRSKSSKHHRDRERNREEQHGNEVKSYYGGSSSSGYDSHRRTSPNKSSHDHEKGKHDWKRKKHRKSRSRSRDRRRSPEHERRRREENASRSPHRKFDEGRSQEHKTWESSRRHQRSRSHSRSTSRERERAREKNKMEVKLQMQRNYEEQLEKLRIAATIPVEPAPVPNQATRLVEEIQKRKLIFGKKPEESTSNTSTTVWKQPSFADDSDGKMSAKFKRLMGMKGGETASPSSGSTETDAHKKHQQCMSDLEKQYEVARMTTHTQRGLGLGFGSSSSLRPQ